MTTASIATQDITGVILAGGLARRMGGVDKGLQMFQGQPLINHALQRLRPQVAHIGVNANRSLETYQALNVPVWPDATDDFSGPLSGFLAGLSHCKTPFLVTVPCDTPHFPKDLVARLGQALLAAQADIAMAAGPENNAQGQTEMRTQPVFCLIRAHLLTSLQDFMRSSGRKIDTWTALHSTAIVPFDQPGDHAQSFFNINTLQQLHDPQALAP